MSKPTTAEVLSGFSSVLEGLKNQVALLTTDLSEIKSKLEVKEPLRKLVEPAVQTNSEKPLDQKLLEEALDGPTEPVSPILRAIVDQILNKSFGIHIKSEIGAFRFTLLVPKKYSPLSPDRMQFRKFDMRSKVIENAEGENGVKLWCETVFNNFDQAMQGVIVSDRLANL